MGILDLLRGWTRARKVTVTRSTDTLKAWKQAGEVTVTRSTDDVTGQLLGAISNGKTLTISYYGGSKPGLLRKVGPRRLFRKEKSRTCYLEAYCYNRGETRTFRVDNIVVHRESQTKRDVPRSTSGLPASTPRNTQPSTSNSSAKSSKQRRSSFVHRESQTKRDAPRSTSGLPASTPRNTQLSTSNSSAKSSKQGRSNFVAIDFETANHNRNSACAVGLVHVINGSIVEEKVLLIRPPEKRFTNTRIHHLTWRDVRNKPTFEGHWETIEEFILKGDFLAAHNAGFDRSVLKACCETYGLSVPAIPFACTVQLARNHLGIDPAKLDHVCKVLGIPLDHHEAGSDTRACAKIVIAAEVEGWKF